MLLTLKLWEKYCHNLCNQDSKYQIVDIFTFNKKLLDMNYIISLSNKICILLNPDCDFPPPKCTNTYEFDPKYNGLVNICKEEAYKSKCDYRIIDIIEKYNIKIVCYSASVHHTNIVCIPLGVSWQTEINETITTPVDKDIWCYANFGIPTITRWFGNPRLETYDIIKNKSFVTIENTQLDTHIRKTQNNYTNYFEKLKRSRFSICPRGCGIDSYRVYDSIICNCIPIMLKNEENYLYYKKLPILFIDNYDDLDQGTLIEALNNIDIQGNKDKLLFEYWQKQI